MTGPRDSRLRVLFLSHELTLTGAPRLASEIVRILEPEIVVRAISASGGPLEHSFRALGDVDVLSWAPKWLGDSQQPIAMVARKGFRSLRAPVVGARARRWRPDVVYANSTASMTLIPRLGLSGVPTLLHVHELSMGLARLTERHRQLVRSIPSRYVAVSQAVAAELVDHQGIDRDRVLVVPPLIDAERIVALAGGLAAEVAVVPPNPIIIGGAGNPHWTKGIELWLLMARAVLDRLGPQHVRFRWVGVRDNEAGAEFRTMIEKLGLRGHVDLVGEIANPYPEFRKFGIFAMTSWEEAASLVTLENMALGVPVACFRGSGGPAEEVGDSGLTIEQFSPTAMADSIVELTRDPDRLARLALAARARVGSRHAPPLLAAAMSAALRQVASLRLQRGGVS